MEALVILLLALAGQVEVAMVYGLALELVTQERPTQVAGVEVESQVVMAVLG